MSENREGIDAVKLLQAYKKLQNLIQNKNLTWEQRHREVFYGMIRDEIFDADPYLKQTYAPLTSGTDATEVNHFVDHVSAKVEYIKSILTKQHWS